MTLLVLHLLGCASEDRAFPDVWAARWVGDEVGPDGSSGGARLDLQELADGRLLSRGGNGHAWVGWPGDTDARLGSIWDASVYGAVTLTRAGAAMTGEWDDGRRVAVSGVVAAEPEGGPGGIWLLEYERTDWGCEVYHTPWSGTVELLVGEGSVAVQRNGLRVTLAGTLDGAALVATGVSLSPYGDQPIRETLTVDLDEAGGTAVGEMEQASETGCVETGAVTLTRVVTRIPPE